MGTEELTALAALTFDWTRALDDVWTDQRYHVDGLHAVTAALIGSGIRAVTADGARPLGIVIQGQRGVGKTHLLGWTREQVQRDGGYFFLVGDLFTKAFWEQVLGSMVEQLLPLPDGSRNQLATLLTRLADRVGLDGSFRAQVTGEVPPTPEGVKVFIAALRRTDPSLGLICQDTARALVLLASPLQEDQDVGYYYLTGNEVDLQDRRHWRINSTRKIARLLVNEVSQLLALAGPIVLAIDQVDALIDELVGRSAGDAGAGAAAGGRGDRADGAARRRPPHAHDRLLPAGELGVHPQVRGGHRHRPVPRGPSAAEHPERGHRPPDDREAVRGRLRAGRASSRRTRPGRSCPPRSTTPASTPRARCSSGSRRTSPGACRSRRSSSSTRLDDVLAGPAGRALGRPRSAAEIARPGRPRPAVRAAAARTPTVSAALDPETEDAAMPPLLAAGLEAWARELGGADDQAFVQDSLPGKNPRLHACLRMLLDLRTERRSAAGRSAPSPPTARGPCRPGSGRRSRGRPGRGRRGRRRAAGCSCSGRPRGRAARSPRRRRPSSRPRAGWCCRPRRRT